MKSFKEWLDEILGSDVDPMDLDADSHDFLKQVYNDSVVVL